MRPIDADAFKEYCLNGLIEMEPELSAAGKYDFAIKLTKELLKDVDEQPTIEVQTFIHAKWIWDKSRFMYVCSNCKGNPTEGTGHSLDYSALASHYHYCKDCGAKMDLQKAADDCSGG